MKKIYKLSSLIIILLSIVSSNLYCNPFFSNSTENTDETGNIDQKKEIEPVPVLSGPANPKMAKAQGSLREKIADFFRNWKNAAGAEKNKILWGIILTSFIYGIIHAAGPGHRKTVVFSLYIARKSPWYEPLITGIVLALLHGGCAIIIMLIFKGISGSISANTNSLSIYMEGFSYGLIIIMAIFMIVKETIEYIKTKKNNSDKDKINELKNSNPKKLIPFLLSGIYPCPGAILILILSFSMDILWAGITSVIAMSVGMAVIIVFTGYLAWFGRQTLFNTLKNKKVKIAKISFIIELIGYSILLIFSLYVSLPFFFSLVK